MNRAEETCDNLGIDAIGWCLPCKVRGQCDIYFASISLLSFLFFHYGGVSMKAGYVQVVRRGAEKQLYFHSAVVLSAFGPNCLSNERPSMCECVRAYV